MHTTTFSPSEGKNTCLKNKKYVEKSQPCLALNLIDFQIAKPQTNFVYFVPLLQSERVLILWNVTIFLKKQVIFFAYVPKVVFQILFLLRSFFSYVLF